MKFFLPFLLLLSTWQLQAQRTCATHEIHEHQMNNDPEYAKKFHQWEAISQQLQNGPAVLSTVNEIVIPVVFHIVWNNSSQNITELRVKEQIETLNRDFNALNADSTLIPFEFFPLRGKFQVRFVLANRDPLGSPTNGIVRKQTTKASFNYQTEPNAVKSAVTGGSDAWNTNKYLNIWTCNLSNDVLGYATFPNAVGTGSDGVVLGFRYVGSTGASSPFNKGRTGTHEVGHWMNLFHIWGDDGSGCSGSDQVNDTPNQAGPNYGCTSFPRIDACALSSPGVMFMNFMDYTDDACMFMFTQGQVSRMQAVFSGPRSEILTSNGYIPLKSNDLGTSLISSPTNPQCESTFRPTATFTNFGENAVGSFTANYQINGGPIVSQSYTGIVNSGASVIVAFNESVNLSDGNYIIKVFPSAPNSSIDPGPENDTIRFNFSIGGIVSKPVPFSEGFETAPFPNNGFIINNPDDKITWARTTNAKKSGNASLFLDNFNYDPEALGTTFGQLDDLVLPFVDLTGASSAKLTFAIAAAQFTDLNVTPNNWDTLQIFVSSDCGLSRTKVYEKSKNTLVTVTLPTTIAFTPTSSQWRTDEINLTPYVGKEKVQITIRNISHFENNIYLDDLNITKNTTTGISTISLLDGIQIYPNPTENVVTVELRTVPEGLVALEWLNTLGQAVIPARNITGISYKESFDLNNLPKGLYMVRFIFDNGEQAAKKVMLK